VILGFFSGLGNPFHRRSEIVAKVSAARIRTQKPKRKLPTLWVAAKWTFGIAETYDDCQIDKDEQYPKEKLAEP